MSEFDLAKYDDEFAKQELDDKGYEKIPDGKYVALVTKVSLEKIKSGNHQGDPRLAWQLEVKGPTNSNARLFRNNLFNTPEQLKYLRKDLHLAGLDIARVGELEARLAELLDSVIEVQLKTSADGKNQNVYFNKYLGKKRDQPNGSSAVDKASQDFIPPF